MESLYLPFILNKKRHASQEVASIIAPKKLKTTRLEFRLISICSRDDAETSRLILAYANIPFENYTVQNREEMINRQPGKHNLFKYFFYKKF